jgi:hypothetical protein
MRRADALPHSAMRPLLGGRRRDEVLYRNIFVKQGPMDSNASADQFPLSSFAG